MAGSTTLFAPSLALSQTKEDPCNVALEVLSNLAQEVENPKPWAINYGRDAIDHLRDKVDHAMRLLEQAEERERKLEQAFWADMFSTVGGAIFTGIGVTALATGAAVFAPVTLLVAGAAFGGASYWAQTTFDGGTGKEATAEEWATAIGDPAGNGINVLGDLDKVVVAAERFKYVEKLNLSKVIIIGDGVKTFAKIGGTALSAMTTLMSAMEAWDTHQWEEMAEDQTEMFRKNLENLQKDLRERTSIAYLADMHQASAKSLLDDFQNGKAKCYDGLIMRNPSVLDTLEVPAGTGGSNGSAGGTGGLNGSNDGPQLRQAEPRNKRLKFTTGN